jgi:hypothetical protein
MTALLGASSIVAAIAFVVAYYGYRVLRRIEVWGQNLDEREREMWENGFADQPEDERASLSRPCVGGDVTGTSGRLPHPRSAHVHN